MATLHLPLLATKADFETGSAPDAARATQETLAWAEHWVILYPLWLGSMPALLKGFFEQVGRPGFAFRYRDKGFPEKLMAGRSAHVVVTMGMPGFLYRWFYGAHSLKALKRNILGFIGVGRSATRSSAASMALDLRASPGSKRGSAPLGLGLLTACKPALPPCGGAAGRRAASVVLCRPRTDGRPPHRPRSDPRRHRP